MTRAVRLVASDRDRLAALEQRADDNDKIIKPMAEQVSELYGLLEKARTINWFVVKIWAWVIGGLGAVAVVLTIASNAIKIATGH
jgi:hypothetical protein